MFAVESAAQFAKMLKLCNECHCFILNFTYHLAPSDDKIAEVSLHSDLMLDKLEKEYLAVFSEPKYPIWEHFQPFWTPLIDINKYSVCHCLHPLSGKELTALKK